MSETEMQSVSGGTWPACNVEHTALNGPCINDGAGGSYFNYYQTYYTCGTTWLPFSSCTAATVTKYVHHTWAVPCDSHGLGGARHENGSHNARLCLTTYYASRLPNLSRDDVLHEHSQRGLLLSSLPKRCDCQRLLSRFQHSYQSSSTFLGCDYQCLS